MTTVFLAHGSIAFDLVEVIGVFATKEAALQRCRDRPSADEEGTWNYDRWWVEEWEVDGDFVAQYDVLVDEVKVTEAESE